MLFLWTVGKLLKKIMPINSLVVQEKNEPSNFGTNSFECDLYSKMKQEQDKSISNNVLEANGTILVPIYYITEKLDKLVLEND
ncbi:Uncharacterised protein [Streptococcus pneumoniae]|nr:Uncharacterised protein [Streptococcus pneumoniae]